MHPMCLKSIPNTPHFDLFFRFFNAVFGDPDLCYACPSVGVWAATPLSILTLEQILAQKSCFPKSRDQLQLIWPVFRIFFPKIAKKLAKIENLPKSC